MSAYINRVLEGLKNSNIGQLTFIQAATEVLYSLEPLLQRENKYEKHAILERITIPERAISFRVTYVDDNGRPQVNNAYRVQFNSAIGPYKGGLRFHPTVNLGVLKFLGFEQIFKNSLTGVALGGGKAEVILIQKAKVIMKS
ncbi:NAD-specific glutamate dehydrogenase [Campylobacter majalis]|uniref:NAD-specific glutamate dehydrogenase n=1 Tax=Campylobacter majalis TaxID=2790656 RepID=A0ABN7K8K9_9BACT|nr:NAD-specific glutamate dehydrogenase [Campylobacter majalis]